MKFVEKITYVYSLLVAEILSLYFGGYVQKLEINKKGFQEFEIRDVFDNVLYKSKASK